MLSLDKSITRSYWLDSIHILTEWLAWVEDRLFFPPLYWQEIVCERFEFVEFYQFKTVKTFPSEKTFRLKSNHWILSLFFFFGGICQHVSQFKNIFVPFILRECKFFVLLNFVFSNSFNPVRLNLNSKEACGV